MGNISDEIRRRYVWVGGVTSSSATFSARIGAGIAQLSVSTREDMSYPLLQRSLQGDVQGDHAPDNFYTLKVDLDVLPSATQLFYQLHIFSILLDPDESSVDSNQYTSIDTVKMDQTYTRVNFTDGLLAASGRFRTFPNATNAADGFSFKVGVGSCARSGSESPAFSRMADLDLDLVLQIGDLHYENIKVNDISIFDKAYEGVFLSNRYRKMLTRQPIAYVWDDHDFGPNDSDAESPSKLASRLSYAKNVPHYPLAANASSSNPDDRAIYQSFGIGRVWFVMSDLVSEFFPGTQRFSAAQEQWLYSQLRFGRDNYRLIVWVTSKPWIGPEEDKGDSWTGSADLRLRLSNFIARENISNLIAVAGDAHMIAIDDGTNTDYSEKANGGAGFPILQAAPLEQYGSSKGGPFSHGCHAFRFSRNYQFGLLEIEDNADRTCVSMKGFDAYQKADAGPRLSYQTCTPIVKQGVQGGGQGSCSVSMFRGLEWAMLVIAVIALAAHIVFRAFECAGAQFGSPKCFQTTSLVFFVIGLVGLFILTSTPVHWSFFTALWIAYGIAFLSWTISQLVALIKAKNEVANVARAQEDSKHA